MVNAYKVREICENSSGIVICTQSKMEQSTIKIQIKVPHSAVPQDTDGTARDILDPARTRHDVLHAPQRTSPHVLVETTLKYEEPPFMCVIAEVGVSMCACVCVCVCVCVCRIAVGSTWRRPSPSYFIRTERCLVGHDTNDDSPPK